MLKNPEFKIYKSRGDFTFGFRYGFWDGAAYLSIVIPFVELGIWMDVD